MALLRPDVHHLTTVIILAGATLHHSEGLCGKIVSRQSGKLHRRISLSDIAPLEQHRKQRLAIGRGIIYGTDHKLLRQTLEHMRQTTDIWQSVKWTTHTLVETRRFVCGRHDWG